MSHTRGKFDSRCRAALAVETVLQVDHEGSVLTRQVTDKTVSNLRATRLPLAAQVQKHGATWLVRVAGCEVTL